MISTEPIQENQAFKKATQSLNIPDTIETQTSKNASKMDFTEIQNLQIEFTIAINILYKKKQLKFQFQNFSNIKVELLSTVIYHIMILLILLVSVFEIVQHLSSIFDALPLYDTEIVHIARLIATSFQALFCVFLLLRLGLRSDPNSMIVKLFLCLISVALIIGISVFSNLNQIYPVIEKKIQLLTARQVDKL